MLFALDLCTPSSTGPCLVPRLARRGIWSADLVAAPSLRSDQVRLRSRNPPIPHGEGVEPFLCTLAPMMLGLMGVEETVGLVDNTDELEVKALSLLSEIVLTVGERQFCWVKIWGDVTSSDARVFLRSRII